MNSDTVKGKIDDAAGRARRQVGEWTGKTEEEIKGAAQQVKGKAEKVVGKVRDAIHDAAHSETRDANNTTAPDDIDDDVDREEIKRVNQK
jgi:uncharacterized protein YjbJ (UPF0337 family)